MASLPPSSFDLALVGAGRVGTAVAHLLRQRGHRVVGVASRTSSSAEAAAARLQAPVVAPGDLPSCDVVLMGVPEAALRSTVDAIADGAADRVLVHLAGSAGIEPLAHARNAAARCALHPVQACPDVDTAVARLPGSAWGVTCSSGASAWAHRLITEDLGGAPVDVAERDRPLWHAAAVTTSNGIAALMGTGEALLAAIGVAFPDRVLGPIAAGTVANARDAGGGAIALTGPIVRGEHDVIRAHLDAVRHRAPDAMSSYVHTLRSIVTRATASQRIDAATADSLMALLESR